ncbi:MAG: sulfite exporter TauE/SafE family protein [Thermosulfidibacteraceae bacterium]|jgi:uncharacterized membrane protein YfcA
MIFYLLLVGFFAGFLGGLLGVGGGIIMVPSFYFLFGNMHASVSTSVLSSVFFSLSATISYFLKGVRPVNLRNYLFLVLSAFFGSMLGVYLLKSVSSQDLKRFFAIFLTFVAIYLFVGGSKRVDSGEKKKNVSFSVFILIGFFAGFISAFFGVGGGIVMVPALIYVGLSPIEAISTSIFTIPVVTLFSLTNYLLSGIYPKWIAIVTVVPAGILGSNIGVRFAFSVSQILLRRLFALFIIVVVIRMLY